MNACLPGTPQARGQLGNGVVGGNNPTPQKVPLPNRATQIDCGDGFTAALLQDKSIWVSALAAAEAAACHQLLMRDRHKAS